MRLLFLLSLSLITACAVEEKRSILISVESGSPADESDLRHHCDYGDAPACTLLGHENITPPEPHVSIVQGIAPIDRAVFAALVPRNANLSWFVFDPETLRLTKLFVVKPESAGVSTWAVQRLDVQGLLPDRTYDLLAGDAEGHLLEDRKFRTFAMDEKQLRIAILGGWRFSLSPDRAKLIDNIFASQPQLLVFAGSVVDATLPTSMLKAKRRDISEYFFARQAEERNRFEFGFSRILLPTIDLWNDDEFGEPNGDRSFTPAEEAREQLTLFFPHWADDSTIVTGPGISLSITFRNYMLILADDISARKPAIEGDPICIQTKSGKEKCLPGKPIPPPTGTRYGGVEQRWVADRAAKAQHPLWILAGGRFLFPFEENWVEQSALNSPSLTQPPKKTWLATIVSDGSGALRLTGGE
jgi:hypothetical protein